MNRKPSTGNLLQQLPTKWAVTLVVAVIAYAIVQPVLNNRLGWNLPSVASLSGQEDGEAKATTVERDAPGNRDGRLKSEREQESVAGGNLTEDGQERDSSTTSSAISSDAAKGGKQAGESNSTRGSPSPPPNLGSGSAQQSDLRYGLLKSLGNDVYLSPAGLRYTPGSEEGHRLKHIEKHLSDQPSRPNSHGVFDGDMPQVLRWIDEAYGRAERGAKGTTKRKDRGRVVMEVPFSRPIGFVGGQTGKRKGNPDAKRLRLVIDGDRVITAFPF
ncbi:MAG: hypothetical protein ACE361_14040 [Aureliella sp.]